jgi:glycine/D-amino acid oxidase-like deaminating enzyme
MPVPGKRLLHRIVLSPGGDMKQQQDGRIVIGASFGGSPTTDTSLDSAKRILDKAARYLPAPLGWRPMPKDDYPIIGFANSEPSVYLAVTHSGITLGPLIGQLAAVEILNRVDVTLLQSYRLSRFDPGKR